jgi:hypothetical protein
LIDHLSLHYSPHDPLHPPRAHPRNADCWQLGSTGRARISGSQFDLDDKAAGFAVFCPNSTVDRSNHPLGN